MEAINKEKVINQAKEWLGLREADMSFKPIIDTYNTIQPLPRGYRMTYTDPWCAAFVSAVFWKACQVSDFVECSCEVMINKLQNLGMWEEDESIVPAVGDLVFYDWQDSGVGNNQGTADHVGIVSEVKGNTLTIIEGNCSDMVKQRTISVNARNLRGYGRIKYAGTSSDTPAAKPQPTTNPTSDIKITLPVLERGDADKVKKGAVWTMQTLLINRGFSCGPDGADGDFGDNTYIALLQFQRTIGHQVHKCDQYTWAFLLKNSKEG